MIPLLCVTSCQSLYLQAHCDVVVVAGFMAAVRRQGIPGAVSAVLHQLCELYAVHGLVADSTALIHVRHAWYITVMYKRVMYK